MLLSLTGWIVGFSIAAVVVLIVVVLVAIILRLARVIALQAREVTFALDDARENTTAMWQVSKVTEGIKDINRTAAAAREVLEGRQ